MDWDTERGLPTQIVLTATGTGVIDGSDDDLSNAIVALSSSSVGDLDFATAIGAWGGVVLPEVGEGDDHIAVLT